MTEWTEPGVVELTAAIRRDVGLPDPPFADLAEFTARYVAAERAAWRYRRAMLASPPRPQLLAGWDAVLAELERTARLCVLGASAPDRQRRSSRHDPSGKLTRRQRLSPRARHLHNVHRSVVALERAADGAAQVVVAAALAHQRSTRAMSEVDSALVTLGAAVEELTALTAEILE